MPWTVGQKATVVVQTVESGSHSQGHKPRVPEVHTHSLAGAEPGDEVQPLS